MLTITNRFLFICDPKKNTNCRKSGCGSLCRHTTSKLYSKNYCDVPCDKLLNASFVTSRFDNVNLSDDTTLYTEIENPRRRTNIFGKANYT